MPTGSREGWDRRPGLSSCAGVCVKRGSDLVVALVPDTLFVATALELNSGGRRAGALAAVGAGDAGRQVTVLLFAMGIRTQLRP